MAIGENHDAHQQRQQENMRHVERPHPTQDFQAGEEITIALQNLAVGQHGCVARQKHEDFRGVTEPEVLHGDIGQGVVGHVIPENEDQRQASKKVDARVASVQHGSGLLNK